MGFETPDQKADWTFSLLAFGALAEGTHQFIVQLPGDPAPNIRPRLVVSPLLYGTLE